MRRLVRFGGMGVVAMVAVGLASCARARTSSPATPSTPAVETATADDAGACGGKAIVDPPLESASEVLTRFGSSDEIRTMVKELQQRPLGNDPSSSAGVMWGDSIGDAFGAGGLGLSGIGEGGGGTQEFGMIGMLAALNPPNPPEKDSITNNQHATVDEGGIVKMHGDHLVVLRRGRLFTVRADDLTPVAAVDAFAPGTSPNGAWYDEMLVSGDTIAVVGYSYARGGTEVGLFDIDARGHIRARATYQLRSNDYYSSRNYASRLVGNKLVFYTPLYVNAYEKDALGWMPAMRRWRAGATPADFQPTAAASAIYRPLFPVKPNELLALHTVTTCDLSDRASMSCSSRGVIAGAGRSFYVSPDAVYVWTMRYERGRGYTPSIVYRLPLDENDEPGVLRASGAPIDQFSFLEKDGHLNVVVRAQGKGDAMWSPELTSSSASLALLRVRTSAFTKRPDVVTAHDYVKLPSPGEGIAIQNRFVGDNLVYAGGMSWGRPKDFTEQKIFVTRFADTLAPTHALPIGHAVDRIEPLGSDAIAIGPDRTDLHFSSLALSAKSSPHIASRYTRAGATQGELRSHGFFYRPDGEHQGWVGVPIRGGGASGYEHLVRDSAKILYVRNDGLTLREAGTLSASDTSRSRNDGCVASCVDWYGNARPLFLRGRMLALLGYEIVEGQLEGASLHESKRTSFAPRR